MVFPRESNHSADIFLFQSLLEPKNHLPNPNSIFTAKIAEIDLLAIMSDIC